MKSIQHSVDLDAPVDVVWRAIQRPESFVHVAGSWLRFPAAERRTDAWKDGGTARGVLLYFGWLPLQRYNIEIISIDDETRTLVSSEHGGVVRSWAHTIYVEKLSEGTCRYTDRVDIDAGWLTWFAVAFANPFYRYRQRRWRRLARLLNAAAAVPTS